MSRCYSNCSPLRRIWDLSTLSTACEIRSRNLRRDCGIRAFTYPSMQKSSRRPRNNWSCTSCPKYQAGSLSRYSSQRADPCYWRCSFNWSHDHCSCMSRYVVPVTATRNSVPHALKTPFWFHSDRNATRGWYVIISVTNTNIMSFYTVFVLFYVFICNRFENTLIYFHPNHLYQTHICIQLQDWIMHYSYMALQTSAFQGFLSPRFEILFTDTGRTFDRFHFSRARVTSVLE
jgi:hypothetical protein